MEGRTSQPASISSLETVLIDTPVTREIDRMDDPSQSIWRIWTLVCRGSLFMPVAATRDATSPAELAFAVPTPALDRWISWIPLHRLHAMLQERVDRGIAPQSGEDSIPDISWPTFKVPGEKKGFGEDDPA